MNVGNHSIDHEEFRNGFCATATDAIIWDAMHWGKHDIGELFKSKKIQISMQSVMNANQLNDTAPFIAHHYFTMPLSSRSSENTLSLWLEPNFCVWWKLKNICKLLIPFFELGKPNTGSGARFLKNWENKGDRQVFSCRTTLTIKPKGIAFWERNGFEDCPIIFVFKHQENAEQKKFVFETKCRNRLKNWIKTIRWA